jgi:hypothetical protein
MTKTRNASSAGEHDTYKYNRVNQYTQYVICFLLVRIEFFIQLASPERCSS